MPQISVIVPVYKVEKYINRCVDSILSQTFTDFELILVDDGSPDRCGVICDAYAARDERVRVLHQNNNGVSAARNAGIDWAFEKSDSEWLFFADSDDWIHRLSFETLIEGAKTTGLDVVVGNFRRTKGIEPTVNESDFKVSVWETDRFYFEKSLTATLPFGKLFRKQLFTSIRYPIGKKHEDEWTTWKILYKNTRLAFIDAPLYFYFQNPDGIISTQKPPDMISGLDAQLERIGFFRTLGKRKLCVWQSFSYRKTIKKYITNPAKYRFDDAQVKELICRLSDLKNEMCFLERAKDVCAFCTVCFSKAVALLRTAR